MTQDTELIHTVMNKSLSIFYLTLIAPYASAEELSYFDLSFEQLLQIELEGDSVTYIDLALAAETNNPFGLPLASQPKSIEVFKADTINARGLKNIVKVAESMTGILSGESPSEPYSFSTRGFSRDSINVVYDGISMGVATYNTRPLSTFHVQQVEFIKGPAELAVGLGGAGGTINIITKKAEAAKHHVKEILVSAGEFATRSFNLGAYGPITEQLFYRVDISRDESDGWVQHSDSFSNNFSVSLLWQPIEKFELLFSSSKQKDQLPAYWGTPYVPESVASVANSDVIKSDAGLVIDEDTRFVNYNILEHEITSQSQWNRVDANWELTNSVKLRATIHQFSADRYWQNAETYLYNPSLARVQRDRLLVDHDRDNWGLSGSVDIVHSVNGHPSMSTIQLSQHTIDFDRLVGFDLSLPTLYSDSVGLYSDASGEFGSVDLRTDFLKQTAQTLNVTNNTNWSESLSTHVQIKYESTDFSREYIDWDGSISESSSADRSFEEISYVLGVSQQISPEINLYTHYAHAHEPVFADHRFTNFLDNLKPSNVNQLEIGIKAALFEDTTQLTFALFNIEKEIKTQVDSDILFFNSRLNSKGVELSINSNLTSQLTFAFSLSVLDAQYGPYFDPEIGVRTDFNEPVNSPDTMANIATSYLLDSIPIEIGVRVNYVSDRWADSSNTVQLQDYITTNLFAAYHGDNYHVALHINNATDQLYGPWSDIYYPNQVVLAAPKMAELTLKTNF